MNRCVILAVACYKASVPAALITPGHVVETFCGGPNVSKRITTIEDLFACAELQPSGCRIWQRGLASNGYGKVWFRGKTEIASRVAWILVHGDPGELCVLHECDTPACINVFGCLFLGTNADNTRDMVAKGRNATGARNGAHTKPDRVPRGERHGSVTSPGRLPSGDEHWSRAHPEKRKRGADHWSHVSPEKVRRGPNPDLRKFTDAQVAEVLALIASGATQRRAAAACGMSQASVGRIVSAGRT